MVIRRAVTADLDAVEAIYDQLHTLEEKKVIRTGWIRHVYPTRATAEAAMALGTLYVLEDEGIIRDIQGRYKARLSFKSEPLRQAESFAIVDASTGQVLFASGEQAPF